MKVLNGLVRVFLLTCFVAGSMDVPGRNCQPDEYVRVPEKGQHDLNTRTITLVSSMAVAPNGRLWATWYCGPSASEDEHNYVVLSTSDDDGATWRELWVADPDGAGPRRPFDPEIWTAPDGSVRWTWAERCGSSPLTDVLWMVTIPDADTVPSAPPSPRVIAKGVMMCKPTFLRDGTWMLPVCSWFQDRSSGFYASEDNGKTFFFRGGADMPKEDRLFDEHMMVERRDGTLWCLSRSKSGLREATSRDGGRTWSPLEKKRIKHTSSRFFIRRLASGNLLLVKHGPVEADVGRKQLTAYLSKDDGATWEGGLLLDARNGISYPSGEQHADGTVYITYDFDRTGAREILFCTFREEDVFAGKNVSGKVRLRALISKSTGRGVVAGSVFKPGDLYYAPRNQRFKSAESSVLTTPGGRQWKTWTAGPKKTADNASYGVLASSTDGGKTWRQVLLTDPDRNWGRRIEAPRLALENGRLVWSWKDRVGSSKDHVQTWCVELDPEKDPEPPFRQILKRTSEDVTVGSYNIRLQFGDARTPNAWDARKEDLADLIARMDLDVLGLQEVCPGQVDFLLARLPQYAMVGVHREDGKRKGEASPVFFRKDRFTTLKSGSFWLSETPDVPGSKSWGTACTRLCSWVLLKDNANDRSFCFANTHTDHISEQARKEGMLLIIRRMRGFAPPGTPIVFTGDHNCCETEAPAVAVSGLLKNAMLISETPPTGAWRTYSGWCWQDKEASCTDALAVSPEARNAFKVENGKRIYAFGGPRIDYIYVSDGIRVKAYATRNDPRPGKKLYPSDHYPVTAVLNW